MLALLFATSLALAADQPKDPAAPPPKAVKLFDGESTFGWDAKGDVTVKDGKLVIPKGASVSTKCPLPSGSVVATNADGASNQFDTKPGQPFTLPPKGESPAAYKAITFTPADLKPLFNGKDLTGWSILKDEKRMLSVAEVTKDGELRLTDKFAEPPRLSEQTRSPVDFVTLQLSKLNWRIASVVLALMVGVALIVIIVMVVRNYKARDPLKNLTPAVYRAPAGSTGDKLPLTNAPARTR